VELPVGELTYVWYICSVKLRGGTSGPATAGVLVGGGPENEALADSGDLQHSVLVFKCVPALARMLAGNLTTHATVGGSALNQRCVYCSGATAAIVTRNIALRSLLS
jgi:hypothetical protein